ncbi:hypothetical protein PIROE2DRAFT_6986 [Piromyces sp. E2]|nr:hypothetical protein PIROE2DRAFT_6986 [Piromyces sp. E2]|eukprot:OUM65915.1 hypothetical protein PIROE2DRAFT_6986 [Piromyces sp. E2]
MIVLVCFEHHEALLDLYEVYMNEKTFNVERSGPYIPVPPIKSKCSNFINIIKNSPKCYVDSDCRQIKQKRFNYEHSSFNSTSFSKSKSLLLSKRNEQEQEQDYEDLSQKQYLEQLHSYDTEQESYCMTPYIPNPFMRVIKFQISDHPRDHYQQYREIMFLSDPREVWDSTALSILNMVPAFQMDGYHSFFALMNITMDIYKKAKKKLSKSISYNGKFRMLLNSNFYVSLVNEDDEVENEELLSTSNDKKKNKRMQYIEKIIPFLYTLLLIVAIISGIVGALSGNSRSLI